MKPRKVLRSLLLSTLAIALAAGLCLAWVWWYFHPDYERIDGTVYGTRSGEELTFDRMRPESPNGLGILLIVSGGWHSGKGGFQVELAAPFLRRGCTATATGSFPSTNRHDFRRARKKRVPGW